MTQDNLKSFARDLGIATKAGIDLMLAPLLDRIAALERARLADAGRIKSLESQLESLESRLESRDAGYVASRRYVPQ